jgi:hypothetical protein
MAANEKPQSVEPPNVRPGVSERDPRVQMAAERTLLAWVNQLGPHGVWLCPSQICSNPLHAGH